MKVLLRVWEVRESNKYCYKERKECYGWVQRYLGDCLCNLNDHLSFGFGLLSLLSWGLAEVPQIISNFRTKSSHGVSFLFLFAWVLGDVFNLIGCLLEPATLPTQYYTAMLYTASTSALVLQSLYYDYLYTWWKCKTKSPPQDEEEKTPLKTNNPEDEHRRRGGGGGGAISIPSTAPLGYTSRKEFYYTSARSMAGSCTPPLRSYMRAAASVPSTVALGDHHSSFEEENESDASVPVAVPIRTHPRSIARMAAKGAIVATYLNLPAQSNALAAAYQGFTGRRLLQDHDVEYSAFGEWMGWLMAAIYMGGRIPQITLNIKRGSVEGLNPLMFVFALVGNITYVASILVRTTEWDKIKPNMPWLLDAVVCVALDLFILMQYAYYRYPRNKGFNGDDDEKDYYVEANPKALVA